MRALRRRYGRSRSFTRVVRDDLTFAEEYAHNHADIVGASAGALVGAAIAGGVGSAVGAAAGGLVGAGVGVALKRKQRAQVHSPGNGH